MAEMDYPIAGPIQRALGEALANDDAGYADPRGLGDSFAPWARSTWGWDVAPGDVRVAPDVVTAMAEILGVATRPGDGVVVDPPVYAPFAETIRRLHRRVIETPLARVEGGYRLDLDAIEHAYADGARAHLLCSPHNPVGLVHERETLAAVAELAARHGVLVVSDEIHAPMTYGPARHIPFPSISEDAARTSVVLSSASKTWNIAGLKSSVMVACHDDTRRLLAKLPAELAYHAGHLGVLGARAAFEDGADWLAETMRILDRNRRLVADLLRAHLPRARYVEPQAGYLAWIDCTGLGLGPDPAKVFLERGRVALSSGLSFGAGGEGFVRVNFATTRTLLEEAIRRMAVALA
ncbi:Cystathionine beta-lyase, type II [Vulgatibacter incomptus]|uniref:cysteine-S-conjugate beta-lyase n=1 Tax=Vulgatibacter incomptus TaxID=1391653 RepID=A0A0K1PGS3_9BACT|nr:Cystathionine beta-lyase, type II [Vulgatibacter incomptus]